MAVFHYRVHKGEDISEGMVEAPNLEAASEILGDRGLSIISIEEVSSEGKKLSFNLAIFQKVKPKDIVVFSRQLSVMISATLPIVQALKILIKQTDNAYFKTVISEIADEVDGGQKFSIALGKHRKVFSNFYISMIKSGETSGKLDEVLQYLADQLEKDYDLRSKIKGAMIYPVFIISGLLVVGVIMMIFVIPKLTEMLTASGQELPIATRILIGTSSAMRNYWWLMLIVIIALVVGFRYLLKTKGGRKAWDLFLIKLPVFGKLFQRIYLVRFTRSLATLVIGGVPLTTGLKIVNEVVGNTAYQAVIEETIKTVEDGESVAKVMLESPIVPNLVSQMMSVGEKTGRLDEVLSKVAEFYSREIENIVANLTSLIEPFIMVMIGVAVGGMVAAIILPMYNLANQF
ncbi:MAG: type II secretion system F family protein [Candidatus Komeilibacteria bacterium]